MLQVTFRNLLPSEELVGAAHEVYREVRERSAGRQHALRWYVTVSGESSGTAQRGWVRVQVELHHPEVGTTRVRAEGPDRQLAVRSSMRAALPIDLGQKSTLKQVPRSDAQTAGSSHHLA